MKKQTPQIKSIFEQISHQVFTMKNVVEAKQFITEFVNDKKINDTDKVNIIKNVNACPSIIKIQSYICNSLLRYEGMGMNKLGDK
jgi:F0F1-type ATP synthase delta subunit